MSQHTQVHEFYIYNNGDVPLGLEYLEKNFSTREVEDIFENARTSADKKARFSIFVDGKTKHYVLTHTGDYEYFLDWANA